MIICVLKKCFHALDSPKKIIIVTIKLTKKCENNCFYVAFTTLSSLFFCCLESKIRAVIADRPIFRKRFEFFLEKKELGGKEEKNERKRAKKIRQHTTVLFEFIIISAFKIKHAIFSIFVLNSKSQRTGGFTITYQK